MNIAICDDEELFVGKILDYLKPYKETNFNLIVSEFFCGEDLIEVYKQGVRFDLIFLDVEMHGISGIEAAQKIRILDNEVMIFFVTSYTKYVPDAFALNAIQFLEKPVSQGIFDREFSRAIYLYKKRKYKYKITINDTTIFLELKDIIYIETFGRHLKAITLTDIYEFVGNISNEEKKLSEYDFIRCHKAYLLNMHYINKANKNTFILSNSKIIPIGRYYKNGVTLSFDEFITGFLI